jgi:hypothetical protein
MMFPAKAQRRQEKTFEIACLCVFAPAPFAPLRLCGRLLNYL